MDEKEYRSTYQTVNPIHCVFEKAINSRVCNCSKSSRFNLADREGVSCSSNLAQKRCMQVLQALRQNSRFALRLTLTNDKLPHNAEIKIQNGGIKGIAKQLNSTEIMVNDIYTLIDTAVEQYKSIETFPYQDIVREISAYQGRRRRKTDK